VKQIADVVQISIVNSINPYRLQGQKTAAFEIIDELGRAPDYHCLPVGNAGNITAYWLGYTEYSTVAETTASNTLDESLRNYKLARLVNARPVMAGYQASGAAPFLRGAMVDQPETVATAIRIGHPQSWDYAWAASRESGGWFDELHDDEILAMQKILAEREGIFCEPASAISVAGAIRDLKNGKIKPGSTVVCTLTGHGLKDPDTAIKLSKSELVTVKAELGAVKKAIVDNLGTSD
jgi:threonine synthase